MSLTAWTGDVGIRWEMATNTIVANDVNTIQGQ